MREQSDHSDLAAEYDQWFDKHPNFYNSELLALKKAVPDVHQGVEIGIGTGRFAIPFKINTGVDPSESMALFAENRGLKVFRAVAEHLPFENESFNFALMVTVDCFLTDIRQAFLEIKRILKPGGKFIIGFIDKNSDLGKMYSKQKTESIFYKDAKFHSTEELTEILKNTGFSNFEYWQTLTTSNENKIELPSSGFGEGSFVVIISTKL